MAQLTEPERPLSLSHYYSSLLITQHQTQCERGKNCSMKKTEEKKKMRTTRTHREEEEEIANLIAGKCQSILLLCNCSMRSEVIRPSLYTHAYMQQDSLQMEVTVVQLKKSERRSKSVHSDLYFGYLLPIRTARN